MSLCRVIFAVMNPGEDAKVNTEALDPRRCQRASGVRGGIQELIEMI